MSKKEQTEQVQEQLQPSLFVEQVQTDKPQEFILALSEYRRTTRNADRNAEPLAYLAEQMSYAWRIYAAMKEKNATAVFVKADNNGSFEKIGATCATFKTAYPEIVQALYRAVSNGVDVAKATPKTGAKGDYVRITPVGGVVGV